MDNVRSRILNPIWRNHPLPFKGQKIAVGPAY